MLPTWLPRNLPLHSVVIVANVTSSSGWIKL